MIFVKKLTLGFFSGIYDVHSRKMGAAESKYRINRTDNLSSPWTGFCTVVTLDKVSSELCMPNGEKHKFVFTRNGLKITEGEHRGEYTLEVLYI